MPGRSRRVDATVRPVKSHDQPPALFTLPAYHGTLAAVRCLGERGVRVTVAGPELFAEARWSRHASTRLFCPPTREPERLLEWLLAYGARNPGHVLYPAGDDTAWLYARHRDELSRHFRLYQPPVEVVYALLNKRRLHDACAAVGLRTPPTRIPDGEAELDRLAAELGFPLLVKPQTQVMHFPGGKGQVASSPRELRAAYRRAVRGSSYAPLLREEDPEVVRPMLQAFRPEAVLGIYAVSGFVDETGEHAALRASRKLLQKPRRLGVGLCFEEAEVEPALADGLLALCRRLGYHGAFEAEFIQTPAGPLLIDFNPRYYGQMAFDIARGLRLPLLVHEAALGRRGRLRAAVDRARRRPAGTGVFCNRMDLWLVLRLQRLAGNMDAAEVARWRGWLDAHRGEVTDPLADGADRAPQLAHLVAECLRFLRHPRAFLRQAASA